MRILVFNAGSSSLKARLYELAGNVVPNDPLSPLWDLHVDWAHLAGPAEIRVKTASGAFLQRHVAVNNLREQFVPTVETLWSGETRVLADRSQIDVVGHRVVHGGDELAESVRITPEVSQVIDRLAIFAPSHNPVELDVVKVMEEILGNKVPQVAVFDTAFHSTIPPQAYVYGGPHEWLDQGIRRYGFHGISHQYVSRRAARLLHRDVESLRLVICHLGSGCSLAAVDGGRSVDTTMGFTPLDGLVMSTRSGSVDPGILIHLLRSHGYTPDRLEAVLNCESGLKGISGVSGDMRQILVAMAEGNQRARLAFDVFVHRVRSLIGSMVASLGDLDALVFTAGVGENSPQIRSAVCDGFAFLGLKLDAEQNTQPLGDRDIARPDSHARVLVIRTEEDWEIAMECFRLVQGSFMQQGTSDS